MFYQSHIPARPLREFIERFWFCSETPSHVRERILPSGTVEIVFTLADDEIRIEDPARPESPRRYSGAVISGTYREFFTIDPLQHASILGVHFRPGGMAAFLDFSVRELADRHIDLESIWGREARELRARLCAASSPAQRFALLEEAFLTRLLRAAPCRGAVQLALDSFHRADGNVAVRDVARQIGISHRRFIECFTDGVGLSPKLYCRILRFQKARERANRAGAVNWAAVAADCGYCDQSHLIRDFREFAGFTPSTSLARSTQPLLPNHVQS